MIMMMTGANLSLVIMNALFDHSLSDSQSVIDHVNKFDHINNIRITSSTLITNVYKTKLSNQNYPLIIFTLDCT